MYPSTFTTIVDYTPEFGVEAYSIETVACRIRDDLLNGSPRGAKSLPFQYSLVENSTYDGGAKFLIVRINIVGMTGKPVTSALIISEQPAAAGRRGHANMRTTEYITCRSADCDHDLFYDLGRSLDYNNHVCAKCGRPARTLTETGASA